MFRLILILCLVVAPNSGFAKKWTGTLKKGTEDSEVWTTLVTSLKANQMHFGVQAGSERMLEYFPDLKSKEFAYQNIVELVDQGFPFSLRKVFMSGDLEVKGLENFPQSYNFYKATIDSEKNLSKWAGNYLARVDQDRFPKYLFYRALKEFNESRLSESLVLLDQALIQIKDPSQLSLAKKISRTMARIYYEQNNYERAEDIYRNYLTKIIPIDPSDWIELAWTYYRLAKFDLALGILYNLEAHEGRDEIFIEKYIIRALIYREKCATSYTQGLAKAFDREFGPTIEKIKLGDSLKTLSLLKRLIDRDSDYNRFLVTSTHLRQEFSRVKKLPASVRTVAQFLYQSEMQNITRNQAAVEDAALNDAARRLVIMGESLRFLQFDVVREQFNPDKVFAEPPPPPPISLLEPVADDKFKLHWLQWGDFWRDERGQYKAYLKNWCK